MSPIYGSSPEGSRLYVMANSGMSAHIRLIVTAMTIVVVSYGERETKVVELLKQLFNPFVYIFFPLYSTHHCCFVCALTPKWS